MNYSIIDLPDFSQRPYIRLESYDVGSVVIRRSLEESCVLEFCPNRQRMKELVTEINKPDGLRIIASSENMGKFKKAQKKLNLKEVYLGDNCRERYFCIIKNGTVQMNKDNHIWIDITLTAAIKFNEPRITSKTLAYGKTENYGVMKLKKYIY